MNKLRSLILLLACYAPSSVLATTLLPISLQQLSSRASIVFHGIVIDNKVRKDERSGHIATFTTFEILEAVKGDLDKTHTIKQIGGHDKDSRLVHRVHGVPEFQIGREYIVFLPEASSLGFSSPLGLQQGSFAVTTIQGEKMVNNRRELEESYSSMPASLRREQPDSARLPSAVDSDDNRQSNLEDFINTVRAYNKP